MKKIVLSLFISMLLCSSAFAGQHYEPTAADSASGTLSLSLDAAKQYAQDYNRGLRNATLSVKQAHASRWQTIATMLPQVDANLNYVNMCGYQLNFGGMMTRDMPPYGQLNLTAAIAFTGSQVVGVMLNNLAIRMQNENYEVKEDQLSADVTQVYTSILVMREIDTLLNESLGNMLQLEAMSQRAVEVGVSEETVADQMAVRVATLKQNINTTERNITLQENSLKLLLGIGDRADVELTDKLDDIVSAEHILELLGEGFDIEQNHNYRLANMNAEMARKNKVMAWMNYTPTISLAYQYSKQKYFSDTEGFSMTPPNTVQLGLSVPIWSSGKRAAGVREKKLAYEAALNDLADARDQLNVQNIQLRYNLNSAYESYEIEKTNLDVNRRILSSTSNKFQKGVASTQELITSSNDFIAAQSSYVNAVLTLVQAQVNLEIFLNK